MGYYVELIDNKFHIAYSQQNACLKAMKQMMGPEYDSWKKGGSWENGKRIAARYSWVNTEEVLQAKTVDEALLAWGYIVCRNSKGDITKIEQREGEAKLGDEELLFKFIKPYITPGSYVRFRGEDGEEWLWDLGNAPISEKTTPAETSLNENLRPVIPPRKIAWA